VCHKSVAEKQDSVAPVYAVMRLKIYDSIPLGQMRITLQVLSSMWIVWVQNAPRMCLRVT